MEVFNTILVSNFFGLQLYNIENTIELILRFAFNFIFLFTLIRYIYYPVSKRTDFFVAYILLSVIVFFLLFLLNSVKLKVGIALGLFAIFGILHYRTTQIPIREMTYLFLVIGLSVINSLANKKVSYTELLFSNLAVLFTSWFFERFKLIQRESKKTIIYEKIDLIKPEKRQELIKDLEKRTGLKIIRIEIGRIDFMRDSARIQIYYHKDNSYNDIEMEDESYLDRNDDE
ncbi:MAG TPA: DUF4956 domain-containing protein [Bacteroidales bacterium]|nr:DUF4956 domain-containing protein [Bacteroidales bacterium]